jgi:biopolymer transport protein ExbD
MQSRRHTPETEDHGIDLAPMLDFVLNLLIFFIIITSFVKEAGVTVNKAHAELLEHRESGNILIAVRENGEVWMERREVDLRDIRTIIERLHLERPDDTAVIIADRGAHAGIVAKVMDEVRRGGIREISLGATPGSEG